MKPIFVIFLLIIAFWSITTTFIAIIKILSNDFKANKIKWILISMIGIIGPILWIIKGKEFLVKKK